MSSQASGSTCSAPKVPRYPSSLKVRITRNAGDGTPAPQDPSSPFHLAFSSDFRFCHCSEDLMVSPFTLKSEERPPVEVSNPAGGWLYGSNQSQFPSATTASGAAAAVRQTRKPVNRLG